MFSPSAFAVDLVNKLPQHRLGHACLSTCVRSQPRQNNRLFTTVGRHTDYLRRPAHTHTPALHCAVVPVRPSPPAPPRLRQGNSSCNTQSDIFAQEGATQPWRLASRSQVSHASSMRCAAVLGVQNRRYPRSRVWACAPCTQHAAVHAAARTALYRAAQPVHVDTNHPQSRTQLACIPRLPVPGARRGLSKRRWRSTCASWRP